MIARQRNGVVNTGGGDAARCVFDRRTVFHLVNLTKRGPCLKVLEILACHLARLATRAARSIEIKSLLIHDSPLSKLDFANVGMLRVTESKRRRALRRQRIDASSLIDSIPPHIGIMPSALRHGNHSRNHA